MPSQAVISEVEETADRRPQAIELMNRGHAGILADSPASLEAAMDDYEKAIALLAADASEQDGSWRNSLAAAWLNRGHLLHRRHGLVRATDALHSFAEAEEILEPLCTGANPWPRRNLAGVLLNRACLLLDRHEAAHARYDADRALELVLPTERCDSVDAEIALKARRAICDCLGQLIVADGADQQALADAAIEQVEAGLELHRSRRHPRLNEAANRLYRFGAGFYRMHQPHFLAEFLLEHLEAGDAARRAIALDAIASALAAPLCLTHLAIGEPASERSLQTWRDLKAAQAFLSPA